MSRMRWSSLMVTSLAASALLVVAVARAENDPNSGASPPPAQSDQPGSSGEQQSMRISGTISAIDTAGQTMTVKGLLLSKTLKVGSDAQIAVEGKTGATLSDLKVGDHVEVSYRKEGSTFVAERITRSASKESQGGSSGPPPAN